MKYCIYLRKSRSDIDIENNQDIEILARHEKILIDFAKSKDLVISKIYRELASGESISDRPIMKFLLKEIEDGVWDGVFVMEIERLARGDTIDQGTIAQAFKYSKTKIFTPSKIYEPNNEFDEEYFEFNLFMSRREYKSINRRMQKGREISAKEGKYIGNIAPYGYIRKKIENDKGYTLEINAKESLIVKYIYELFVIKNISISKICEELNIRNIKSKKGGKWTTASIRDILKNPVYIGKIRWKWRPALKKISNGIKKIERPRVSNCEVYDGIHSKIIDNEIWEKAQL